MHFPNQMSSNSLGAYRLFPAAFGFRRERAAPREGVLHGRGNPESPTDPPGWKCRYECPRRLPIAGRPWPARGSRIARERAALKPARPQTIDASSGSLAAVRSAGEIDLHRFNREMSRGIRRDGRALQVQVRKRRERAAGPYLRGEAGRGASRSPENRARQITPLAAETFHQVRSKRRFAPTVSLSSGGLVRARIMQQRAKTALRAAVRRG